MKCKICGKKIPVESAGLVFFARANCKCGKVRARERIKGCAKCEAHGFEIQAKKKWYGYLLYCTCGHKWRVRK